MPVEGFVGWQGDGKSYAATVRVFEMLERNPNLLVASNIPFPGALLWDSWQDFLELLRWAIEQEAEILALVDEVGVTLPAKFWNKIDDDLLKALLERRHMQLDVLWTTPSMQDTVTTLRRITQVVHYMRRYGGSEYSHRPGRRNPAAFYDRWYRVHDFDDLGKPKAKAKAFKKRLLPFSLDVANAYGSRPRRFSASVADALFDPEEDAHKPAPVQPLVLVPGPVASGRGRGR